MAQSGTDILKVFNMIDQNGSQRLSEDELEKALNFLRVPNFNRGDVQVLHQMMDTNRDGHVSYFEFCARMKDCCQS
jgi:Ca2+-binding EF-hand superfamily protein